MRYFPTAVLALSCFALAACGSDDGDTGDGGQAASSRTDTILALTGDETQGQTEYATCGTSNCHGADGSGSATVANLSEHVPMHTDAELISVIINGEGNMPAQAVSDQAAADIVAYLRATFK